MVNQVAKPKDQRQQLRSDMRKARQALTTEQQVAAGEALFNNLATHEHFQKADTIALYLSSDGEIDPYAVIKHCWELGKKVYLPVLDPDQHNQLLFVQYLSDTPMCFNKYQISEPSTPYQYLIKASDLDLVLLPLVAFDDTGSRMGMGGGYYDRSFAFINSSEENQKSPKLIGLAHSLQQVKKLAVESWDIPLSGIITDQETVACAPLSL